MNIYKEKDLRYNNAHRLLPDWCYMMDIDSVEIRGTKPVALIEYKKMGMFNEIINEIRKTKKLNWQLEVYKYMGNKLEVPVYLVGYSGEEVPVDYLVWKLEDNKILKYNLEKYQLFLKSL